MTSQDPTGRPASGAEAHAALLAVQRALEPKRLLWASAVLVAIAFGSALGFAWFWQRPLPPGPLVAAIADTDNQTGDPELDGVSELLHLGLGQTRRLSLMGRAQLLNLVGEGGGKVPHTIDEATARLAATAGQAQLLIVPSARRMGNQYELSVRASDLARKVPLFALTRSAGTKATLREVVDHLSSEVRRRLGEEPGGVPITVVPSTELAPASTEAWARYVEGQRLQSEGEVRKAIEAYVRAVALEPDFALALEALVNFGGDPVDMAYAEALRKNIHRLAPRGRPYAEFLLLQLEGSALNGEADLSQLLAAGDRAIEAWPEDPRPYAANASLILRDRADLAVARPYMEKFIALAPLQEHRVFDFLSILGRHDEALSRARQWTSTNPGWISYLNLAAVHRDLGEEEEAATLARRVVELVPASQAQRTLPLILVEVGAAEEWERTGRAFGLREPEVKEWLLLRGRVREALASFDAQAPAAGAPRMEVAIHHLLRAVHLMTRGDAKGAGRELEWLFRYPIDVPLWSHAPHLAALGELEEAARLAEHAYDVDKRHYCLRSFRLIRQWKSGDPEGALRGLADLRTGGSHFRRGEILAGLGRDREAVEAFRLHRRQAMRNPWDYNLLLWYFPRSFYFEAAALERLGEKGEARKVNGRLLKLWDRADPDLPHLAEAKALQRRLAASDGGK